MHRIAIRFATALALAVALPAAAESPLRRGDTSVHYNALPTTALAPDVARQYAITRSANRALLNVAVRRRGADGIDRAVAARVGASATNLNGQRQDLAVREVREGEAIYYLAEPRAGDGETLDFELQVVPEGEAEPIAVRFRRVFFAPKP